MHINLNVTAELHKLTTNLRSAIAANISQNSHTIIITSFYTTVNISLSGATNSLHLHTSVKLCILPTSYQSLGVGVAREHGSTS